MVTDMVTSPVTPKGQWIFRDRRGLSCRYNTALRGAAGRGYVLDTPYECDSPALKRLDEAEGPSGTLQPRLTPKAASPPRGALRSRRIEVFL